MSLTATLRSFPDYEVVSLNFSSATTPELILKTFDHHCEYKRSPQVNSVRSRLIHEKWLNFIFFLRVIQFCDLLKWASGWSCFVMRLICPPTTNMVLSESSHSFDNSLREEVFGEPMTTHGLSWNESSSWVHAILLKMPAVSPSPIVSFDMHPFYLSTSPPYHRFISSMAPSAAP